MSIAFEPAVALKSQARPRRVIEMRQGADLTRYHPGSAGLDLPTDQRASR